RADNLSAVFLLVLSGDHPFFNQGDYTIGKHLGVYAEVLVVLQRSQHSVGYTADAELKRGPVLNKRRDITSYLFFNRRWNSRIVSVQRHIVLNHSCEPLIMYLGIAVSSGHVLVDLCDHHAGIFNSCARCIDRGTQRAVSMLIRWRHRDECHIDGYDALPDQPRDL